MKTLLTTTIPFNGFYESYASDMLEDISGVSDYYYQTWEDNNPQRKKEKKSNGFATWFIPAETNTEYQERKDKYFEDLYDSIDWNNLQNEYAKEYTERFAEDNNIKLAFESLDSPREYNFTTDRIFCTIKLEEVKRLIKEVNKAKLNNLIREQFTSRDGFSSYYSNDINDWKLSTPEELDHNEIGTIVQCFTSKHIEEKNKDYPYEVSLMEDVYC